MSAKTRKCHRAVGWLIAAGLCSLMLLGSPTLNAQQVDKPLTADKLRDALLSASSDAEFSKLVKEHLGLILGNGYVFDWIHEVSRLVDQQQFDQALKLAQAATRAASLTGDRRGEGWGLLAQGSCFSDQGKPEDALPFFTKASAIFEAVDDTVGLFHASAMIGHDNARLKRDEAALGALRFTISLRTRLASNPAPEVLDGFAEAFADIADVHVFLRHADSALVNYRAALGVYGSTNNAETRTKVATLRRRLAAAYASLGDTTRAITEYDTAAQISRAAADTGGEANALDSKAFYMDTQGKHQEAAELWQKVTAMGLAADYKQAASESQERAGDAWRAMGESQRAVDAYLAATRLYASVPDTAGVAKVWRALGDVYWDNMDPKLALDAYSHAETLYQAVGDKAGLADTHIDFAALYGGIQKPGEALLHLQQSLAIRRELHDTAGIAVTLSGIADAYLSAANADSADHYYIDAIRASKESGDKEQVAMNTLGRANTMRFLRYNDSAALRLVNEALTLAQAADQKAALAAAKDARAELASSQGDYSTALEQYREALDIYHRLEDRGREVTLLTSISSVQMEMGENAAASETLSRAREIAKSGNMKRNLAAVDAQIGAMNLMTGDYAEALNSFETSLSLHEKAGDVWGIAQAHSGIGEVYSHDGQFQKALTQYAITDSIYRSLGFEILRLDPLNAAGAVYFFQADYERSLRQFKTALDILDRSQFSDATRAIVVGNLGEVYYELGQFEQARPFLDSAARLARRIGSKTGLTNALVIRGKLDLAEGHLDAAGKDLDSALEMAGQMGSKELIAIATAAKGNLDYARHDYATARVHLEAAVRQFDEMGSRVVTWQPLYTLGLVHREQQDAAGAVVLLTRAVDIIEGLRANLTGGEDAKKAFVSEDAKAHIFEALIALLIERGDVDVALHYVERSNNDEIRGKYRGVILAFSDTANAAAVEQVHRLKSRVEASSARVAKARAASHPNQQRIRALDNLRLQTESDLGAFVKNIARTQPALMRQIARTIPEDELDGLLSEVVEAGKTDASLERTADKSRGLRGKRESFPQDAALVAFMPGERQLYIFVASRDTVVAKVIEIGREQLAERVKRLVAFVSAPRTGSARGVDDASSVPVAGDFRPMSQSLDSILLQPIADYIRGKPRLAFLPSGPLQYLPFQVLGEKRPDNTYHFLIEDHTISYVLESATIADTVAPTPMRPRIAAFANADGSLKNAETEVEDIRAVYPDAKIYLRDEAKKATAMNLPADYNVLHFATHGTLDYANPLGSFLALARSDSDDGHLMLSAVGKMANSTKRVMVVLSACNTAVAQEKVAGWPVSPALAFLDNGTKTVIASLWKVDDEATALLMQAFYANLATMGRGLALRRAQESLIHNPRYAHPYYWAAFVVIGEAR